RPELVPTTAVAPAVPATKSAAVASASLILCMSVPVSVRAKAIAKARRLDQVMRAPCQKGGAPLKINRLERLGCSGGEGCKGGRRDGVHACAGGSGLMPSALPLGRERRNEKGSPTGDPFPGHGELALARQALR